MSCESEASTEEGRVVLERNEIIRHGINKDNLVAGSNQNPQAWSKTEGLHQRVKGTEPADRSALLTMGFP